ncbi:MAG: filamentous hemagglutinin N-terminal domain-containing protein, partial [Scytonema sp. PMC 1069.18]|nr:filamentous hemagglutinin N-terminal domain-containing protein [Scytonema sp. PMC 1069.18]
MTKCNSDRRWWQIGITLAATSGALFCWNNVAAQVVLDRTMGAENSIVTPNVEIKGLPSDRIDGGAIRGAELFHSFQEFNVGEGRGVYFSNPIGIENILTRVTGKNASNIFGRLGVLGNANLFLLNPNGIIFGPNASLDIAGSFMGSTANSLNFADGTEFSATNPTAPPLLIMKVPLGVQFPKEQPKAIVNTGNLSAGTRQNLTLLGGTVVSTGQLSAPSGQVSVAAVPGGSVVKLSPTAQLLNIDIPPSEAGVSSLENTSSSSASLTELLTSNNETAYPGLTVNSNGQVELEGSSLPIVDGDVVARNVTAETAVLSANHNLTLVESQLSTIGDLNLLAGDTVQVRDSVANPFVAQAGGQLLVQGKQGVDIFALNHPSSGLVSGKDMVLRSANTVGGDAHYWAGGNFRIEKLDRSLGGLFSPYDPIIRSRGDVSFQSYTGGSLHIFAGGSVTIDGNVEITGADGTNGWTDTEPVILSDRTPVGNPENSAGGIDGTQFPTLDIRAGTTNVGIPEFTPVPFPGDGNVIVPNPQFPITIQDISPDTRREGAKITIGSISIQGNGQVFLTNQYEPNLALPGGSIEMTGGIDTPNGPYSVVAYGDPVTIDARSNVTIEQGIITGASSSIGRGGEIKILSRGTIELNQGESDGNFGSIRGSLVSLTNGDGGNITLTADNDIIARGNITSEVLQSEGNGGDIILTSNFGKIDTSNVTIKSKSRERNEENPDTNNSGRAGDVTLQAFQDIRSGNIEASSNSDDKGFSTIKLESSQGSVILNGVRLTTTNTGTNYAGDIYINGRNIQITNTGRAPNQGIQSQGVNGRVFIGIDEEDNISS